MCSAFKLAAMAFALCLGAYAAETTRVLRIAADPNNLPFSNERGEGFENKIAALIAKELGAKIEYIWRAQRRGFFRETLKEGKADLVMGAPAGFEMALTTAPYYRSKYVFVLPERSELGSGSLDEPKLRERRIGVHLIGDDGLNTPPAHALAERGIVTNLVGFTLYGDYSRANPPAAIIEAVAEGEIDAAIVWGPFAGYFAPRQATALRIVPVAPSSGDLPFEFSICVAVRRGDRALRDEVDLALKSRRIEIERILKDYGVPLADAGQRGSAKDED